MEHTAEENEKREYYAIQAKLFRIETYLIRRIKREVKQRALHSAVHAYVLALSQVYYVRQRYFVLSKWNGSEAIWRDLWAEYFSGLGLTNESQ